MALKLKLKKAKKSEQPAAEGEAKPKKKPGAKKGSKQSRNVSKARAGRKGAPSQITVAAQILERNQKAMGSKELTEMMIEKGLWKKGKGKTPEATLNSAIIREIRDKGKESRFKKVGPGLFAAIGADVKIEKKPVTKKKAKKKVKPSAGKKKIKVEIPAEPVTTTTA